MLSLRFPLPRICALVLAASATVFGQTTTPPQSPTQRDATRPPNTGSQSVPPATRPSTDPTAPPNSQQVDPRLPPGSTPNRTPATQTPPVTDQLPSTSVPGAAPLPSTQTPAENTEMLQDPAFLNSQPRPVPPMPSLARVGVTTGETRPLTLNDAIRRALENNNEIEVARDDVRLSETFLRSLQGAYDPVFNFSPQFTKSISPQPTILGGAGQSGTVSRTENSFDSSVNKLFERGGGNYTFFFNNSRVTSSSTNELFKPSYASNMGVTFNQPLWRDRSIDRTRHDIRIQRKRLEQSDADFRRRTVEVIAQVQSAYWDLVFALRDEQNQIANLNLARENFRRTEAGVAAGATAPLQRAEIQTELSNREAALLLASQNVSVAENNLKQLMLRDPLAQEWNAALVPTDEPSFAETTPVNLTDALAEARANRPELRRLRIEQDVNNIDLQYFKNQTKPRIDIQSTLSTTSLAGTPKSGPGALLPCTGNETPVEGELTACIPPQFIGGYGRNLRNLFNFDTRNVVVGLAIQLPLRNRTAEANLASVRIQREQLAATTRSQEQVVEVEVRNSAQAVETARRRVLAARSARENAELQLAGERRLYQVGRTTTFLLFQRENALVNALNQELRAQTDYNKALALLQRATSTTLRANNVIVESPVVP